MTAETGWWRVHFRKKTILVHGQAELDRVQARKVPKVVLVEVAPVYTCAVCAKVEAWTDTWIWFGSWNDLEDGKPVLTFCSALCRAQHEERDQRHDVTQQSWKERRATSKHQPSVFDVERYRALDGARLASNPRRFPMPEFPKAQRGAGWCRWCGEEILDRKGKNAGKRSRRRNWHRHSYGDVNDCGQEWALHTHLDTQRAFLEKRDGACCQLCPDGYGKWEDAGPFPHWMGEGNHIRWSQQLEVDHVVELWSVADLPDDERRFYFGPLNLWLLCKRHHRLKSAAAAAERAAK